MSWLHKFGTSLRRLCSQTKEASPKNAHIESKNANLNSKNVNNDINSANIDSKNMNVDKKVCEEGKYDKYIYGGGLMTLAYFVTYSIYESKAVYVNHFPALPKHELIEDEEAITDLKKLLFGSPNVIFQPPFRSIAVVGNLGTGKTTLLYQVCKDYYKKPEFYNFMLPKSKICVFLDMSLSDTFLECLRLFVNDLNTKCRNKDLDPYDCTLLKLTHNEQVSLLVSHLYKILKDHPNWCIVFDNVNAQNYPQSKDFIQIFFDKLNESTTPKNDEKNEASILDSNGRFVIVCDENLPHLNTDMFYEYNEMKTKYAFKLVKSRIGISELKEEDVGNLIQMFLSSPIGLLAACELLKIEMCKKKHTSIKDASKSVYNAIVMLTDQVARRNKIKIKIDNFSHYMTLTALSMMFRSYNADKILLYNSKFPFNDNTKYGDQLNLLEKYLNNSFELTLNFFNAFPYETKVPSHILTKFIYSVLPFDESELVKCLDIYNNQTTSDNSISFFSDLQKDFDLFLSELKGAIKSKSQSSFFKPEEKINDLLVDIPFLRFHEVSNQELVSIHPIVMEASRSLLLRNSLKKFYVPDNLVSDTYEANNSVIKSYFSMLSKKISKPVKTEKFLEQYKKALELLTYSSFNTTAIFNVPKKRNSDSSNEKNSDIKIISDNTPTNATANSSKNNTGSQNNDCIIDSSIKAIDVFLNKIVDSITSATFARFGDYNFNLHKKLDLVFNILQLYKFHLFESDLSKIMKNNEFLCLLSKYFDLLDKSNQNSKTIDLVDELDKIGFIGDVKLDCEHFDSLMMVHFYIIKAYINVGLFEPANKLLQILWKILDPSSKYLIYPKQCTRLFYLLSLLHYKKAEAFAANNNATDQDNMPDKDLNCESKLVETEIKGDIKSVGAAIKGEKSEETTIKADKSLETDINGEKSVEKTIKGDKLVEKTIKVDKSVETAIEGDSENNIVSEYLNDDIFTYILLAYQLQLNRTNSKGTFDEYETEFLIEITILLSELLLKRNNLNYAVKFANDANTLNKNILKVSFLNVESIYDKQIQNLFYKYYKAIGNEEMVLELKKKL